MSYRDYSSHKPPRPPSMPIWYVVYVMDQNAGTAGFSIYRIMETVAGDLAELDELYQKYVAPHQSGAYGSYRQTMIFSREPDNPFREMAGAVEMAEAAIARLQGPGEKAIIGMDTSGVLAVDPGEQE